jgi:hypothetical protein
MTDHGRGWVDARLKLRPPCFASPDYIAGYREGLRSRIHEARAAIMELQCPPDTNTGTSSI